MSEHDRKLAQYTRVKKILDTYYLNQWNGISYSAPSGPRMLSRGKWRAESLGHGELGSFEPRQH
jgi:hypothetical protein